MVLFVMIVIVCCGFIFVQLAFAYNPTNLYTVNVSPILRINWNTGYGTSWFDDRFFTQVSSYNEIKSMETNSGNITSITILPIINDQSGNITISLYKNGVNTNNDIIVHPNDLKTITKILNYPFQARDFINWVIHTDNPDQKTFQFNFQETIYYLNTNTLQAQFQGNTNFTSPSNQTGTKSDILVMNGGYATLTTKYYHNATVTVSGYDNNPGGNAGCIMEIHTGTSYLGNNGSPVAGIKLGSSTQNISPGNQAPTNSFSKTVVSKNLTPGVINYYYIAYERFNGGTCTLYNLDWVITEIP